MNEMVSPLRWCVLEGEGDNYRDLKCSQFRAILSSGTQNLPFLTPDLFKRCPGPICPSLGQLKGGLFTWGSDKICQGPGAKPGIFSAGWSPNKVLAAVTGRLPWGHCEAGGW